MASQTSTAQQNIPLKCFIRTKLHLINETISTVNFVDASNEQSDETIFRHKIDPQNVQS